MHIKESRNISVRFPNFRIMWGFIKTNDLLCISDIDVADYILNTKLNDQQIVEACTMYQGYITGMSAISS
ncbi:MAG TPA: hypothetical protein VGC75_01725 [Candidatus Nitrosocosmicus sp.]